MAEGKKLKEALLEIDRIIIRLSDNTVTLGTGLGDFYFDHGDNRISFTGFEEIQGMVKFINYVTGKGFMPVEASPKKIVLRTQHEIRKYNLDIVRNVMETF